MNDQSKMSYLSPFVCYGGRTEIAASESNLSSSGYSSMASPGPSPSCSSKMLCSLDSDMNLCRMLQRRGKRMFPRALSPSLESSSPPPDSPTINIHYGAAHGRVLLPSDSEITDDQLATEHVEHESAPDYESHDEGISDVDDDIRQKIAVGELKSAKELENLMAASENDAAIDPQLLNVVTKVKKSKSLDSKLKGERHKKLKVR